jgi:hypothetical protein
MRNKKWPIVILILNLIVICSFVILFINRSFPMVGHDYSYNIPQVLDSYLAIHLNGLNIHWYTPNFGGGFPAFPNPNNSQFALWAFLSVLVDPWQAVIISSVVYIALGGIACFTLFHRVLKLHWTSSLLGMVFFSANGFVLERISVGHIGYIAFPIIAILVLLLLDSSIPQGIAGLVFALCIAMCIHAAGYFLIVAFGLTILIMLALVYIYRPALFSWRRIFIVLLLGGIVALVISVSKLAAVYAFMRFFPRQVADTYQTTGILQGLFGIVMQLLGTMGLSPTLLADQMRGELLAKIMVFFTGALHGYWEYDMSMSPVVFGIIIIGVYTFLRKPGRYAHLFKGQKKWIAWILLLFFTWLTIEFILARGLLYPHLSNLPILSSLHVNPRYTSVFLFPLAMIAALICNKWIMGRPDQKKFTTFVIINIITLLPLSAYFMIRLDLQDRTYDITESEQIYAAIRAGEDLTVTGIGDNLDNTQALGSNSSNLKPYEPIFGYGLEYFRPEIKAGSIWEISDGYYNMTNPSGYVFPEINDSRPFERIPISQKDQLEAFASHRNPGWKIPVYQQVLDWVSGLTAAGVSLFLVFFFFRKLVNSFLSRRKGMVKA